MCNWHYTGLGGQPMAKSVLYPSRQVRCQFTCAKGMEGLVGVGGKSELSTWNGVHEAAGTSCLVETKKNRALKVKN